MNIPDAELAVMNYLWFCEEASQKRIAEHIYGRNDPAIIATVQKLLARLKEKGLVEEDTTKWPRPWFALLNKQDAAALCISNELVRILGITGGFKLRRLNCLCRDMVQKIE